MSDAKHTPEKWTYTIERVGLGNTRIIQADGTHIATAWFPPVEDDSVYLVSIIKAVGWMLEAANACRGMADPAAEIAELRKKAHGWNLLIQTVQAMADTTTEGQPTTEALLDKVKENMELRAENAHLRQWIGSEQYRSDSRSAADLRAKMEHCRNEATAFRRNEAEALDAIKSVGYTTPHGESDSLGEAVAWLVKVVEAGDRLADAVESANVGAFIDIGEVLGSVIPAVEAYRKERAS